MTNEFNEQDVAPKKEEDVVRKLRQKKRRNEYVGYKYA